MSPVAGVPPSLADHFDDLAAGYGGAAAIAVLTAAQGTKRRLLVRAVVDELPPDAAQPLMDLLVAAERAAPDPVAKLLTAPHVDAWLSDALRRLGEGRAAVRDRIRSELAAFAAAAAAAAQLTFELRLDNASPDLVLPGLGVAVGIGTGAVTIRGDVASVAVLGPTRELRIGRLSTATADTPAWLPVRRLSDGDPEVLLDDIDPYRSCYSWPPLDRLSDQDFDRLRTAWAEATRILDHEHPCHADGVRAALRCVVPVMPPSAGHTVSAASRFAYGAIAISPTDNAQQLAELAIHEVAHMKLYALLEHVDLYLPGGALHYAAWRPDPRPVGALMQGTYAHLAVADYWRLRRPGLDGPWADYEFTLWRRLVSDSIASLLSSCELTPAGERFVHGMAGTVQSWDSEPVSGRCVRLAEDVALGGRVRWCLTNFAAPSAFVARLASAWRRGQPCPSHEPPAVDAKPATRLARDMPRLHLAARAIAGGADAGSSADALLVAGDYDTAAVRYVAAIEEGGGVDDWAGLAVAWHRRGRPDMTGEKTYPAVLRDLFTALAHRYPHPAPEELAEWLTTRPSPPFGR
ncbi:aKG-HExxH-type peptide beta-hydroxylase [Luedemannella helvata]|uniref:HEXXH motif domain-containing protein n=1 Tax=Luedemannella helvata TaxID=349315 RepID=A0ABP4WGB1_9ACTN